MSLFSLQAVLWVGEGREGAPKSPPLPTCGGFSGAASAPPPEGDGPFWRVRRKEVNRESNSLQPCSSILNLYGVFGALFSSFFRNREKRSLPYLCKRPRLFILWKSCEGAVNNELHSFLS